MKLLKYSWIPIFLTSTLALIYHKWIFNLSILTKGDWWFYFYETLSTLRLNYFWLWYSGQDLGIVLLDIGQAPTYVLSGLFAALFGFNWAFIERLIYFWPIIVFTPLTSFLLLRYIFRNNLTALIGAIVYSFNTYFLTLQTGHLTLMAAFAGAPIVFLFFDLVLKSGKTRFMIAVALTLFLCGAYEPRVAYLIVFLLFFYFIFTLFTKKDFDFRSVLHLILRAGIPILLFILLNLFWILGITHLSTLETESLLTRSLWGSQYYNIISALTLFHPWWTGAEVAIFETQPIPFYFFLIPLFAIVGLILNRRNKFVLFFGIISLIGILLAKQEGPPFSSLYQLLYDVVPGFNAFREASKFYFYIVLGYTVLIASFVHYLLLMKPDTLFARGKYVIFFLVSILFLWNTKPYVTGTIQALTVPREIPQDYIVLNNFLLNQSEYFNTLWIPKDSRWSLFTSTIPKLRAINLADDKWHRFVDIDIIRQEKINEYILNPLTHGYSDTLLDLSSVKFVLVPLQDVQNDDDFFISYGGRENPNIRQWYINELDKVPYLERVDIGTKELVVYENENYKPYISSFTTLSNFISTDNLEDRYNFVNQTLGGDFEFVIKNNKFPKSDIYSVFEKINSEDIKHNFNMTYYLDKNPAYIYHFDNASFSTTTKSVLLSQKVGTSTVLTKSELPFNGEVTFYYENATTTQNAISNPSFELGSWQKEVGDCNNFDDDPHLDMKLNKESKTEGAQSLELQAERHIACVHQKEIPVINGKKYLFSFDYQSPNGENAGYYMKFNNLEKTVLTEKIPIVDDSWHTFNKVIDIPHNASTTILYIYSYSIDENTNIITRYDNFNLLELPDDIFDYWLVSEPSEKLVNPKKIDFELINPTKKLVHIKGASTPFYLAMSESYHTQWQLQFNNEKVQGRINRWVPWVKPDRVSDEEHFELNGFLNGWYVNTAVLCAQVENGCTKNPDGTYDMEFVVEFFPQRWFYMGLLISSLTFAGCIAYLLADAVGSRKRKHGLRQTGIHEKL